MPDKQPVAPGTTLADRYRVDELVVPLTDADEPETETDDADDTEEAASN